MKTRADTGIDGSQKNCIPVDFRLIIRLHRCIICAALSDKPTQIRFTGLSKDIITTVECVKMLGAKAEFLDGCITVIPCDKSMIMQGLTLDCQESGSTARFLLPIAAAICKNVTLVGSGRLPERPFSPLCESLKSGGAVFSSDKLPITVSTNVKRGGVYEIPGNISSQYISGLLLMLPLFPEGGEVRITTPLESKGYVDMTVDTMTKFGIKIEKGENSYRVLPNQSYTLVFRHHQLRFHAKFLSASAGISCHKGSPFHGERWYWTHYMPQDLFYCLRTVRPQPP